MTYPTRELSIRRRLAFLAVCRIILARHGGILPKGSILAQKLGVHMGSFQAIVDGMRAQGLIRLTDHRITRTARVAHTLRDGTKRYTNQEISTPCRKLTHVVDQATGDRLVPLGVHGVGRPPAHIRLVRARAAALQAVHL